MAPTPPQDPQLGDLRQGRHHVDDAFYGLGPQSLIPVALIDCNERPALRLYEVAHTFVA